MQLPGLFLTCQSSRIPPRCCDPSTGFRIQNTDAGLQSKHGPAPSYLKALITPRTAPRTLRSTSSARLVPPSLRLRGSIRSILQDSSLFWHQGGEMNFP
ncbi:isocitrate dehydrogenase [NADP] cytoplasmic isoform X1, partial [Tachysurus ichikawai]